jgi:tRNA dimethylallyltransferase
LAKGYSPALPTLSAIGYRECVAVLEGRLRLEEAKQAIGRATRVFVRRQANWFKESDPAIVWFQVADGVVESILRHIQSQLKSI